MRLAGGGVHGGGRHSGAHRRDRGLLRLGQDGVGRGQFPLGPAEHVGARAVRPVARGHHAGEVDHDRIAVPQDAVAGLVVRQRGVGARGDDHVAGKRVTRGQHRRAGLSRHLELTVARRRRAGERVARDQHRVRSRPPLAEVTASPGADGPAWRANTASRAAAASQQGRERRPRALARAQRATAVVHGRSQLATGAGGGERNRMRRPHVRCVPRRSPRPRSSGAAQRGRARNNEVCSSS